MNGVFCSAVSTGSLVCNEDNIYRWIGLLSIVPDGWIRRCATCRLRHSG